MGEVIGLGRAPRAMALARHLERTADWIESGIVGGDAFGEEDAIAALRWSAAFLRRDTIRDDDLEGALAVFRHILPGFEFSRSRIAAVQPRPSSAPPDRNRWRGTGPEAGSGSARGNHAPSV